jgi:PST family polysaccharide transporter
MTIEPASPEQQPEPPHDQHHVARKTTYAVIWNYASFALGKFLVFLTMIILARLLSPAEFGLVSLATLAINYLFVLKSFGLSEALIHYRDDVERAANTVFTLNVLIGISLSLVSFAIAPFVGSFFNEPAVIPVLRVLGLSFIIQAVGAVHIVRLQRELAFNRKLVVDIGNSLVKGIVSISCALLGFGAWSLVIGQLAGAATMTVLAWIVFPWLPRLSINLAMSRRMLRYGFPLMGSTGLTVLSDNLDYLFIGRLLGNTALGIYTLAYRLPELVALNILYITAQVLFPAYAAMQHQMDLLRKGFLTTVRLVQMIMVPLCMGLVVAADPLVRVAFGEQWLDAIPVVRLIALFILTRSIGYHVGDVYKAVGRPDLLVKLDLLHLVLLAPALWYGTQFGLVGVGWAHVLVSLLSAIIYLAVAMQFLSISLLDIVRELKPAMVSGSLMTAACVGVLVLTADMLPLLRLIILVGVGAVSYAGSLWLLERDSLLHMIESIRAPEKRKKNLVGASA